MAGISLLRPQYTSLGAAGARSAHGARHVAHEADQNEIAGLSEGRSNGGQDEAAVQETMVPSFEQRSQQDGKQPDKGDHPVPPPVAAAPRESGGEFHVDPHLPPPERMVPAGLMVEQPLPMPERLRVAEQAYSASRNILQDGVVKPGSGLDAAS
jgi:hypothetical protein